MYRLPLHGTTIEQPKRVHRDSGMKDTFLWLFIRVKISLNLFLKRTINITK